MYRRPPATYQVDGAAIRTRRMALGMSQAKCAAKAGLARPYLSQLETGARQEMRPPTYARLCTALQCQQPDLLLRAAEQEQSGEETHACHEGAPRPGPDD